MKNGTQERKKKWRRKKPSLKWHKELTPEELKMIEEEKDEIKTKKATKWAVNILRDFLYQKQKNTDLETYSVVMLNDTLCEFYASVQAGGEYSVASCHDNGKLLLHNLSILSAKLSPNICECFYFILCGIINL